MPYKTSTTVYQMELKKSDIFYFDKIKISVSFGLINAVDQTKRRFALKNMQRMGLKERYVSFFFDSVNQAKTENTGTC